MLDMLQRIANERKTMNSVKTEWNAFANMVIMPQNPSEIQLTEMKKAFYAGIYVLCTNIQQINNQQEIQNYLKQINQECQELKNMLLKDL